MHPGNVRILFFEINLTLQFEEYIGSEIITFETLNKYGEFRNIGI